MKREVDTTEFIGACGTFGGAVVAIITMLAGKDIQNPRVFKALLDGAEASLQATLKDSGLDATEDVVTLEQARRFMLASAKRAVAALENAKPRKVG